MLTLAELKPAMKVMIEAGGKVGWGEGQRSSQLSHAGGRGGPGLLQAAAHACVICETVAG